MPVFVWIQGGGYNALTNANYDGSGLIEASDYNIVVVTFNYRVGPYGFLASEEVEQQGSLNNGLKDMIKLLQWVQKYIDQVSRPRLSNASMDAFLQSKHESYLTRNKSSAETIIMSLSVVTALEQAPSLYFSALTTAQTISTALYTQQ